MKYAFQLKLAKRKLNILKTATQTALPVNLKLRSKLRTLFEVPGSSSVR